MHVAYPTNFSLPAGLVEARGRVMLEVNVSADRLEEVIAILPCMREPTIARLKDGSADFSFSGIKTAVLLHVRREGIPTTRTSTNPALPSS